MYLFIYISLQRIYTQKPRKTSLQLCSVNVFIILSSWTIILLIEVFEVLDRLNTQNKLFKG